MVEYNTENSQTIRTSSLKILVSGKSFQTQSLTDYQIVNHDPDLSAIAETVQTIRPNLVIADAANIGPDFSSHLVRTHNADLPILLRTFDEDADNVGHLLDCNIHPLSPDHSALELQQAVQAVIRNKASHASESSADFLVTDKLSALKKEADRVSAALAALANQRIGSESRPVDAPRIRAHIRSRRLREKFFPSEILADPAWDMLLDLAAAKLEQRPVSVSSLCIASNVPTTTALRWIKNLTDQGIFERSSDPSDARRAFISLSGTSEQAMEACLDVVLNLPGQ